MPAQTESFDAFYTRYRGRLAAYAARILRDRQLADDVAQETLARAFAQGLHEEERDPWPWLALVLRNLVFDMARSNRRRPVVSLDNCGDIVDRTTSTPDSWLTDWAAAEPVRRALEALNPRHRELLAAKYLEELPYAEIAGLRQETIHAVQSSLARARRHFSAAYEAAKHDGVPVFLLVRPLRWLRARARKWFSSAESSAVAHPASLVMDAVAQTAVVVVAVLGSTALVRAPLPERPPDRALSVALVVEAQHAEDASRGPMPKRVDSIDVPPARLGPGPTAPEVVKPLAATDGSVPDTPEEATSTVTTPIPEGAPMASAQFSSPDTAPAGFEGGVATQHGEGATTAETGLEWASPANRGGNRAAAEDETHCVGVVMDSVCTAADAAGLPIPV